MLSVFLCLSGVVQAYFCGTCLPEKRVIEDVTPLLHAPDNEDFSRESATSIRLPQSGVELYRLRGWKADEYIHIITLQHGLPCPLRH